MVPLLFEAMKSDETRSRRGKQTMRRPDRQWPAGLLAGQVAA
jgi:hypothetical protein